MNLGSLLNTHVLDGHINQDTGLWQDSVMQKDLSMISAMSPYDQLRANMSISP